MGKRSSSRKFRCRRRTGVVLFISLVILVLGGMTFFGLDPTQETTSQETVATDLVVDRVQTPDLAGPPKAVVDPEVKKEVAENKAGEETRNKARAQAKKKATELAIPAPATKDLYLTVPRLGIYGDTVRNDDSSWALDQGAIKLPSSGFPWQPNANTYIAGHRIGYSGTESYYQFYDLPAMQKGDDVLLEDANGTKYTYQVSKVFSVSPQENWVTAPIAGRDMVTLQTCTETLNDWWTIGPNLMSSSPDTGRLIVQADRVDVKPA